MPYLDSHADETIRGLRYYVEKYEEDDDGSPEGYLVYRDKPDEKRNHLATISPLTGIRLLSLAHPHSHWLNYVEVMDDELIEVSSYALTKKWRLAMRIFDKAPYHDIEQRYALCQHLKQLPFLTESTFELDGQRWTTYAHPGTLLDYFQESFFEQFFDLLKDHAEHPDLMELHLLNWRPQLRLSISELYALSLSKVRYRGEHAVLYSFFKALLEGSLLNLWWSEVERYW